MRSRLVKVPGTVLSFVRKINPAASAPFWKNLLYASGRSVRHVITGGIVQVQDGALTVADASGVVQRGGEAVRKIWQALESEGWFDEV